MTKPHARPGTTPDIARHASTFRGHRATSLRRRGLALAAIGASTGIVFAGAFIPAAGASAATETGAAPLATSSTPAAAQAPATSSPTGAASSATASNAKAATVDDNVKLMSEFGDYWKPATYDDSTDRTKAATGFRGDVTEAGSKVLKANDETYSAINAKAAKDDTQAHRGLVDADYDWKETLPDSLGPVLSKYFSEGIENGDLSKASAAFDAILKSSSTGQAKPYFNYPRPFLEDRSFASTDTPNNLRGLDKNLGASRIPDWTDSNGKRHSAEYDELAEGYSQAFPSGHTTFAYEETLLLAELLPELGPEIATRGSEAGNNRITIGVHYPLDVMGGRILGHAHTAATLSGGYIKSTLTPARSQLVDYLEQRCKADGHASTLAKCITATSANGTGGYANKFTDAVATVPVTDRASALEVYRERMTYGFKKVADYTGTSAATKVSGSAAKVPDGAADLLATTFPTLSAKQRTAVLAATEIAAGYPLDSSSKGWARIDLPAAMSSKVTLDADGKVTKVEPGQARASVVKSAPSPSATPTKSPDPGTASPSTPAAEPGHGDDSGDNDASGDLPRTGTDLGLPVGIGAALVVGGATVYLLARRRKHADAR